MVAAGLAGFRSPRRSEKAGRMAVHVSRSVQRELRELVRRAADDAGEVHHLREPEHAPPTHERLEVAGRERAAWGLEG